MFPGVFIHSYYRGPWRGSRPREAEAQPLEAFCYTAPHMAHAQDERLYPQWVELLGWLEAEASARGLDAILVTTSGCGTVIKDYGHMLREDPQYAASAAAVSALAKDISEYLAGLDLQTGKAPHGDIVVAYHSACSLQHGQKITSIPKELLSNSGFVVKDIPESHLCCGSAGTYNILQPDIAMKLRDRKVANIATVKPNVIAAGNIGCMMQIASGTTVPVVHTVELLDWATGGPRPGLN